MRPAGDSKTHIPLVISESRVDEYLGVGYLTAALRTAGFIVDVFQMAIEDHVTSLVELLRSDADIALVGVTWLYDASAPLATNAARLIKEHRNAVAIVVGGHPPSLHPGQALALAPDVDFVLRGESDYSLVALARTLSQGGTEFDAISGIVYRAGTTIAMGPAPAQLAHLDDLEIPARDTLEHLMARAPQPESVLARLCGSRGCYARCEFCSMVSFYDLDGAGMKWRYRSATNIVDEITQLTESHGVRRFWFIDDEFLGTPKEHGRRALDIAKLLLDRGLEIEWGFDARANGVVGLPDDGLDLLRAAGVRVVAMGLESGSQAALKRLNKGMQVASNWGAVERLRQAGIAHRFGFIMYDPGSTLNDLRLNLEFVRFAEPHRICNTGPFRLLNAEYPQPGTPMAIKLGIKSTTDEALSQQNKPNLTQDGLGYEFSDQRVARIRRMLHRFATDVVEPAMIPRPVDEPTLLSDIWWEGTNYLPQNVAAMSAFLDVHEWALTTLVESDSMPPEVESLFSERVEYHLNSARHVEQSTVTS